MGWTKIEFFDDDAVSAWHDFRTAFSHLHLRADERDDVEREVAALYSFIEPWMGLTAYLSPVASEWVQRALPGHELTPCARPRAERVTLEVGDAIALDTAYVELPATDRAAFMANFHGERNELAALRTGWESYGVPIDAVANDNVYPIQRDHQH